jgi:outer membrane protein OmpA-like peptidoglycan-associated protein
MFKPFFQTRCLATGLVISGCLLGCASAPPKELVDARAAYQKSANGPAARYSPAELNTAQQSLARAEKTFEDDGDGPETRDQAYVALRQTQRADTRARTVQHQAALEASKERAEQLRTAQLANAQKQLADEAARRKTAEEELARLAQVKQDERGTVITLSGSVLFASDKAELLPEAQQRLTEVANALNSRNPNAQIVIEGTATARARRPTTSSSRRGAPRRCVPTWSRKASRPIASARRASASRTRSPTTRPRRGAPTIAAWRSWCSPRTARRAASEAPATEDESADPAEKQRCGAAETRDSP